MAKEHGYADAPSPTAEQLLKGKEPESKEQLNPLLESEPAKGSISAPVVLALYFSRHRSRLVS